MPRTPIIESLRPTREKVFGEARGIPLDRNAKARILVYARGYNARYRQAGQHRGPITRAFMEVLETLLWGFHNAKDRPLLSELRKRSPSAPSATGIRFTRRSRRSKPPTC